MRKFYLKLVIKLIRKHFAEGISVITNADEDIIAYQWAWSKEIDNLYR